MKRFPSLLIVFVMISMSAVPGIASTLSERYEAAEELMIDGKYMEAADAFDALMTYSDASYMAMYCRAVYAGENGLYDTAVSAFASLGDFKDSAQMSQYYTARQCQSDGTLSSLTDASDDELSSAVSSLYKASAIYVKLALYKDCLTRYSACADQISAIEQEQESRQAAKKSAEEARRISSYNDGLAKRQAKDWHGAIEAFIAAGNYSDAKTQLQITYYEMGIAMREEKRWSEALEAFEAANGYSDTKTQIQRTYYEWGIAKYKKKDWDGAIAAFQKAGNYSDSTAQIKETQYQKAAYLCNIGKYEEALDIYSTLQGYRDVDEIFSKNKGLAGLSDKYRASIGIFEFGKTKSQTKTALAKYKGKISDTKVGEMDILEYTGSLPFVKQCFVRLYYYNGKMFSFFISDKGADRLLRYPFMSMLVRHQYGEPQHSIKTKTKFNLPLQAYHGLYPSRLYRTKNPYAYSQWLIVNKDKSALFIEVVDEFGDGCDVEYTLFDKNTAAPYIKGR